MNPQDTNTPTPQVTPKTTKKSSLKTWTIIANITFITTLVLIKLIDVWANSEAASYIVFGTMGLAGIAYLIVDIILILIMTVSAGAAITLNTIYLPRQINPISRRTLVRVLLAIVNTIIFLGAWIVTAA